MSIQLFVHEHIIVPGVIYGKDLKRRHPFNEQMPIFDVTPDTSTCRGIVDLQMMTTNKNYPFDLRFWDSLYTTLTMAQVTEMCHTALQSTNQKESVRVSIDNPSMIRLTGKDIAAVFCHDSHMQEDIMTAIMCAFNEFDSTLDSYSPHRTWRSFLPALSLEAEMERPSACAMEVPTNWKECVQRMRHNIPDPLTAMVFLPILIKDNWHCFAFNMKGKHIHIQMPHCTSGNDVIEEDSVKQIGIILLDELIDIINDASVTKTAKVAEWTFKFDRIETLQALRGNGFAACLYALLFDGTIFRNDVFSELNSRTTDQSKQEISNVAVGCASKAAMFSLLLDRQENPVKLSDLLQLL